jgi:4-alpha-glucanotransferase
MTKKPQIKPEPDTLVPFKFRGSGILMHPTSLPGGHGTGDLGVEARRFAEWLHQAGQSYWQMLPLCPPGTGFSPYDSPSANAISPLLISLDDVAASGLIARRDVAELPQKLQSPRANFDAARKLKDTVLRRAHEAFATQRRGQARQSFDAFCHANASWLEDYSLFSALKQRHGGAPWHTWSPALRDRNPRQLALAHAELALEVDYHRFVQYELHEQWQRLRNLCTELGVLLMGDLPIYVAYDSVDVWAHRETFHLDKRGQRKCVAGVPPDYFSKTGQLWGNPLYDWKSLKRRGFAWWVERMRVMLSRFDAVRLDHFIGFRHYWEVPASATTAERGRYVRVPAEEFFQTLCAHFAKLPFLAEDLGTVTPEIHRLRLDWGLPGMRILQFAFDDPSGSDYLPHRFERNTVVYTGTHDNDTLMGWLGMRGTPKAPVNQQQRAVCERALAYLGEHSKDVHWAFIRLALQSVANTAIFPIQDILGLGSNARMNRPATTEGNWSWRMAKGALTAEHAERLRSLCQRYERIQTAHLPGKPRNRPGVSKQSRRH